MTVGVIEIGRDLTAVKQHGLEHGQFCQWVRAECGFSIRTASNYMLAAKFAETWKLATVANLAPAAVYKLAAKSTPAKIVVAVMARVEKGEIVASAAVDEMVKEAARERRDVKCKEQRAFRRSKKYKEDRERRDAERLAQAAKENTETMAAALKIVEKIGIKNAQFVLSALEKHWYIKSHLRRALIERRVK